MDRHTSKPVVLMTLFKQLWAKNPELFITIFCYTLAKTILLTYNNNLQHEKSNLFYLQPNSIFFNRLCNRAINGRHTGHN